MNDVTNQNDPNNNNDECEEIIYASVVDMYNIEWEKTHDIENKATGIVGFVGVIFGLIIASLSAIISIADLNIREKIFSSTILFILIGLILVFLTLSILCGIMALIVKDWNFLRADEFKTYYKCQKPNKKQLYTKMTNEIIKNIVENRAQNRNIARYLKISYILFMASIIVLFVYFVFFLYIIR